MPGTSGNQQADLKKIFADDALSIEPYAMPPFEKETKRLSGFFEKGRQLESIVEAMHGTTVSDPIAAGNVIAFALL